MDMWLDSLSIANVLVYGRSQLPEEHNQSNPGRLTAYQESTPSEITIPG